MDISGDAFRVMVIVIENEFVDLSDVRCSLLKLMVEETF